MAALVMANIRALSGVARAAMAPGAKLSCDENDRARNSLSELRRHGEGVLHPVRESRLRHAGVPARLLRHDYVFRFGGRPVFRACPVSLCAIRAALALLFPCRRKATYSRWTFEFVGMTPELEAVRWYLQRYGNVPGLKKFMDDIEAHQRTGYVWSTDKAFMMARPVIKEYMWLVTEPTFAFDVRCVDAWYIWLAAGDMNVLWELMPYPLPFIGWARREDDEPRFYLTDYLRAKCKSNPLFIPTYSKCSSSWAEVESINRQSRVRRN